MRNFLTTNLGAFDFDDFFDGFFKPMAYSNRAGHIKADIMENEKEFELSVDLPGFDKSDINLTLDKGHLIIKAEKSQKEENKDNYIRRERSCSLSRSFYVGENVSEEDIKAKYNNGTLTLNIPKLERKEKEQKQIQID